MARSKKELNAIKQSILDICARPETAKYLADKLIVDITTIYNTLRYLEREGYIAIMQAAGKNMPRYNITLKPIYDTGEADDKEVINNKSLEEGEKFTRIGPNHRRISCKTYSTKGHTPKRSSWVASSLQGFQRWLAFNPA